MIIDIITLVLIIYGIAGVIIAGIGTIGFEFDRDWHVLAWKEWLFRICIFWIIAFLWPIYVYMLFGEWLQKPWR